MDWTLAATILVPMLAGFGWIINRIENKFDGISAQLLRIEQRLSRLEGYIEGQQSVLKIKGE